MGRENYKDAAATRLKSSMQGDLKLLLFCQEMILTEQISFSFHTLEVGENEFGQIAAVTAFKQAEHRHAERAGIFSNRPARGQARRGSPGAASPARQDN